MTDPTQPTPAKPGYQTTEFWIAIAVTVCGVLLGTDVLPSDHWAVKVAGVVAAALAAAGYSVSRGQVKAAPTTTPAPGVMSLGTLPPGKHATISVYPAGADDRA